MTDEPKKARRPRRPPDACLMALLKCQRALDELRSFEERRRVIHWVTDQYSQRTFPTVDDIGRAAAGTAKGFLGNVLTADNAPLASDSTLSAAVALTAITSTADERQAALPLAAAPAVNGAAPAEPQEDGDAL